MRASREGRVVLNRAARERQIVRKRSRLSDDDFVPDFSALAGDELDRERNFLAAALGVGNSMTTEADRENRGGHPEVVIRRIARAAGRTTGRTQCL